MEEWGILVDNRGGVGIGESEGRNTDEITRTRFGIDRLRSERELG